MKMEVQHTKLMSAPEAALKGKFIPMHAYMKTIDMLSEEFNHASQGFGQTKQIKF
jgi:hypothetical protein